MENKKYYIMTSEQKEMLQNILKAVDIDFEDFLLIGNMREYDTVVKRVEAKIAEYQTNLIQLNNRINAVEERLQQMEADSLLGVMNQNESY